jgi:hypothetical protein
MRGFAIQQNALVEVREAGNGKGTKKGENKM